LSEHSKTEKSGKRLDHALAKKACSAGIGIKTRIGVGYYMTPEAKDRLSQIERQEMSEDTLRRPAF
jgi:hypothetical protein